MDRLNVLRRAARLTGAAGSLDDAAAPVLRLLAEALGMQRATITVRTVDGTGMLMHAAHGLAEREIRGLVFADGEGLVGRVAVSGQPISVPSIALDPHFSDKSGVLSLVDDRCYSVVPIIARGAAVGTLGAFRPVSQMDQLDLDVASLSVVAGLLAPLVEAEVHLRPEQEAAGTDFRPSNLVGRSKAMLDTYDLLGRVAESPTTVLLLGESGTGKELAAKAIHKGSPRARKTLVKVNCAALPENLVESELFGHERGAFTGADRQRKGRFEEANGGTIFLDEIGELSPATQVKLLRVLQERVFERVGSNRPVSVDVRVITATSRDLLAMVEQGSFRRDLYYRLNVFPIRMPALRERKGDVLLLADYFVDAFNRAHGKSVKRISTAAIDMLVQYHWPGNVRELENIIERAVLLARDDVIGAHHLPPSLQTAESTGTLRVGQGLKVQLEAVERELVIDALKTCRGNVAAAARQLEVTERIMGLRVAKYDIDARRFQR